MFSCDVMFDGHASLHLAGITRLVMSMDRLLHLVPRKFICAPARSKIVHHHDLDGRLCSLFLDADRREDSCACFETSGTTPDDAQLAKKRHRRSSARGAFWSAISKSCALRYAETLRAWRERFMARRQDVVQPYDDRFARMWKFALASEMSFRKGTSRFLWQNARTW
jgi:cyclopropane fatty-acyl-phospholipid synthase-like methyltransferase